MSRKSSVNRSQRVSEDLHEEIIYPEGTEVLLEPEELESLELVEFNYLAGPKRLGGTEFEWDDLPSWEPILNGKRDRWK